MVTGVEIFASKFFFENPLNSVASSFVARIFRPAHSGERPDVLGKALAAALVLARRRGTVISASPGATQAIDSLKGFPGFQVLLGHFVSRLE